MPNWSRLIRFVAQEDGKVHLGEVVGSYAKGSSVKEISGTVFDGKVTNNLLTVSKLLSPLDPKDCPIVRCIGLNYVEHSKETKLEIPKKPIVFIKPRTSIAGPGSIVIPKIAQDGTSDYEAELGVVIGKPGKDISVADALDHVLGYTNANDISARNEQFSTSQWSFSKGFDDASPIGPMLVSPSVIPDPQKLSVEGIYNEQVLQKGHTSDMLFSVATIISFLSQGTTLEPGTLILTGTPSGIGFTREPRIYLEDGSKFTVKIEGLGELQNDIVYEK